MRAKHAVVVALFLVAAVAVTEAQQPGGGRGGFRTTVVTQVISNKDLQEELKVTDAQKEKFKAVAEKKTAADKAAFGGGFGKGGFDKEKAEAARKDREALNEEITKVVESTLTAEQKKRVAQIQNQSDGIRAFGRENVAADLKLTDAQKGKIKGISDDYNKDIGELFGKGGFGGKDKEKADENRKKREKLTKSAMADIDDVLTDDQRKAWKEMVGAPFDTTKLNQFGGFGGGNFGKNKTKD